MAIRRVGLVAVLLLGVAWPVAAQHVYPRADLFAGYSFLPANEMDWPRDDSQGFHASITSAINPWLGIVGDFGAHFNTVNLDPLSYPAPAFPETVNVRVYEYLAGPRFTARAKGATLFAHALLGGATGTSDMGGFSSNSGFTFGGGGGLDVRVTRRVAVRAQLDMLWSFAEMVEDNPRLGIGIVAGFGQR